MGIPIVYLVSDSVGETVEFVVRAAAAQFDGGHCDLRRVPYVQDLSVIDRVLQEARSVQGIVAYTLVLPELRDHLVTRAKAYGVRAVDAIGPMITAFAEASGEVPRGKPGLVHQMDDEYFRRVEAVEFAVKYDDGRDPRGLALADIILIGVSRTSKTPLSMYLAHRRLRVANVPLIPEVEPPAELFCSPALEKTVGLTIRPEELNLIRQERLKSLGLDEQASYASPARIREELAFAKKVMDRLECPVIDVSSRAVEETAGVILQLARSRT